MPRMAKRKVTRLVGEEGLRSEKAPDLTVFFAPYLAIRVNIVN